MDMNVTVVDGADDGRRVILFFDLDCFYAQVEAKRCGYGREVPLAVQQWNGLIATNYKARELGITRGTTASDCKVKFPQVKLVHVEVIKNAIALANENKVVGVEKLRDDSKVSLRRYREASFEVMNVIRKFAPMKSIERASIDEVYVDVTQVVKEKRESNDINEQDMTIVFGEEDIPNHHRSRDPDDWDLNIAAGLMREIRAAVEKGTGFQMSGAVACNKLLAKVATSKNKPNKQTLVPRKRSVDLIRSVPIRKIPGFGGKFGKRLCEFMQQQFPSMNEEDTKKFTFSHLIEHGKWQVLEETFQESAHWIRNIADGVDNRPVTPKMAPKSLLSAKSFGVIKEKSKVRIWLDLLVRELFDRSYTDSIMFSRVATKMTLHFSSPSLDKPGTKRIDVPNPNPFLAYTKAKKEDPNVHESPQHRACVSKLVAICLKQLVHMKTCSRLALGLDTFIMVNIPGSWVQEDEKWTTKQQNQFVNYFKHNSTTKQDDIIHVSAVAKRKATAPSTSSQAFIMDMFRKKNLNASSDSTTSTNSSSQDTETTLSQSVKMNAFNQMLLSSIEKKWDATKTSSSSSSNNATKKRRKKV